MISLKRTIVFLAAVVMASSNALAQELSVDYKDVKLSTVLVDIQNKTGFHFIYNNSLIDVDAPVSASVEGSLTKVLGAVLGGLPVRYEISDRQIILSPASPQPKKSRSIEVSGVVVDDQGLPLPGVFVSEKGTKNATITDIDGRYSMTVAPTSEMEFTCLGMKAESLLPPAGGKLDLQMKPDTNYLDEVVVVGYGVQKRANLTGAVSTVNFSEGMESRPITTVSSALGGLAPGLAVMQTSGQPGSDSATLRVRGNTTLNSNGPLVLVDGIEYSMDEINPQDIESITVLKDASSTAIYGSRAANGVILVTTKGGSAGKTHVTYTMNMDMQTPYLGNLGYVTDYAEQMRLINEGADNLGVTHVFSDQTINLWENAKRNPDALNAYGVKNSIAYPNTDWFKEAFQHGLLQKHNLSVSSGNETVKSYISIGFMDNTGVMSHHGVDSGTKKFDIRANVDVNVTKWLSAGVKVFGERQDYGLADVGTAFGYLKMAVPGMYPGSTNKWGYIATDEESANANNIFKNLAQRDGEKYYYRGSGTAYLKAKLYKGLSLEFTGNHNFNIGYTHSYSTQTDIWNYVSDTIQSESSLRNAWNEVAHTSSYRTNGEAILRYNGTFGKHEIGAIGGFSVNHYISPYSSVSKKTKTDWVITEMSAYAEYDASDSGTSDWGLMSGFGRLNYVYDGKYMLEANFRADGSSRFAPQSRWGFFPSFSAGWRISQEKWMQGASSWLSNLKLRASWGVTGNNNSGNYAWQSNFTSVNVVSMGVDAKGLLVTELGNNSLQWETTKTGDVGVDFGFLDNKLTGEVDAYIKNTTGILFRPSIYMTMGAVTAPYENLAGVRNRGLELALKWRDGIGRDFSYSVGLNLAYNRTTVTKYKGKLIQEWSTDPVTGENVYINNIGDVGQSGFGGYIVEGHLLGDQYMLHLYNGSGKGYSGSGDVDVNAGPVDGMIRTESDMAWVQAMMAAGYKFQGGKTTGKDILYYGDFIYADTNGDGNYGDNNDKAFTGHSNTPRVTAGLNISMSWKGIDFYALFTGAFGFYLDWNTSVYNTTIVNRGQAISRKIASDHYYYNPEGDPSLNNINATYPRLLYNKTMNDSLCDFYHYKGDYVKLKSIQLGYTFPKKWMEPASISSLRVFVAGENLLTFTKFPGLDPEIGAGVGYPLIRSFCGGLQLTF